jgi:NAD(P)H-dependent FMN reductase
MLKLHIIVGSTRPTRAADAVTPWIVERAQAHGAFEVELLDLRDWPLPMFAEHMGSIGDFANPTYSDPLVRAWNQKIKEADAVLIITPEYNHAVPGVLKNAIDSVFVSFALRNKPLACVSYSGGIVGGVRAIENLYQIAIETEMVPLRNSVIIPYVSEAFTPEHQPVNPASDISLSILLDDLSWWGDLLKLARATGELLPGSLRMRAGLAKLSND